MKDEIVDFNTDILTKAISKLFKGTVEIFFTTDFNSRAIFAMLLVELSFLISIVRNTIRGIAILLNGEPGFPNVGPDFFILQDTFGVP